MNDFFRGEKCRPNSGGLRRDETGQTAQGNLFITGRSTLPRNLMIFQLSWQRKSFTTFTQLWRRSLCRWPIFAEGGFGVYEH